MRSIVIRNIPSLESAMPYKFEERNFHLTESGWHTSDVPVGARVESWRLSVYQESAWSKEQQSWSRIWHSVAWSEIERDRLRRRFPSPVEAPLLRSSPILPEWTARRAS
jgi:hypothetical protein